MVSPEDLQESVAVPPPTWLVDIATMKMMMGHQSGLFNVSRWFGELSAKPDDLARTGDTTREITGSALRYQSWDRLEVEKARLT